MDWAVFDGESQLLEGPYEEFEDGQIRAERAVPFYPPQAKAWAGPVCDWHPDVPRESCPGYPHDC